MNNDYFFREEIFHGRIENWIQYYLLFLLALYALAKVFYPRYWRRFFQALIFPVEGDRLLFEQNTNIARLSLWLNTLAGLSVSLYLFLVIQAFTDFLHPTHSVVGYLLITGLFGSLSLIKYGGNLILGYLFKDREFVQNINHQWLIHYKVFGFIMFFWSVMMVLLEPRWLIIAVYGGLASLFIMFIMSTIKGLLLLYSRGISLLYGILYLCTLEFLPVLLIVRMIIS